MRPWRETSTHPRRWLVGALVFVALICCGVLLSRAPMRQASPSPPAEDRSIAPVPTPVLAGGDEAELDGAALVEKVRAFYGKCTDYSAEFEQVYRKKSATRVVRVEGSLQVKKPGFIRWDYEKPYKKLVLIDSKALYSYVPEDHMVQVKKKAEVRFISDSISFLWGGELIGDASSVARVERPAFGSTVIELTPRQGHVGLSKLFLSIDPRTGAVLRSVVLDAEGNESVVTFLNPRVNQGLPDTLFKFVIPQGAQVEHL